MSSRVSVSNAESVMGLRTSELGKDNQRAALAITPKLTHRPRSDAPVRYEPSGVYGELNAHHVATSRRRPLLMPPAAGARRTPAQC